MSIEVWNQAVHILKKDIRALRVELGLLAGLLVVFGLTHGRFPTYPAWALLGVGAAYLIARLIHAEPIPGDAQFWITRPYYRSSLLAAKLLFILLLVNLPVFVVQMAIFLSQGFNVMENAAGTLWAQCLLVFLVSLPVAALASLTRGIGGFALCGVVLTGAVLGLRAVTDSVPEMLDPVWIRLSLPALLLAVTSLVVIWLQYGGRRTRPSQILAVAGVTAALLAIPLLPARVDAALRAWAIPDAAEANAPRLQIRVDPSLMSRTPYRLLEPGQVEIEVPLGIATGRDDVFLDATRFAIELGDGDGERIASVQGSLSGPDTSAHAALYARLDRRVFEAAADRPVRLRAAFDIVLIGEAEERIVRASATRFAVSGIDCGIQRAQPRDRYDYLECRSPLRWPALWIQTDFAGNGLSPLRGDLSYSPFPGGLDLNHVESQMVARRPEDDRDIRIVTRRPIGYVHEAFETEIDLREFVIE
jgi:hypothetical protein